MGHKGQNIPCPAVAALKPPGALIVEDIRFRQKVPRSDRTVLTASVLNLPQSMLLFMLNCVKGLEESVTLWILSDKAMHRPVASFPHSIF